jgi:YMGG-like Gly-zipper
MAKKYLACVLILTVSFVAGTPTVTFAQSNKSAWESLSALQAGHKVQVVEMNSKKVSGAFVNVTDTGISLQGPGGEQTIPRQDVRSVKLMENKHRLRNTLIGAAIGAGVGAGIGAEAGKGPPSGPDLAGFGAGLFAVIGGAAGAIVGALWPSHQTIYRATGR